MLEKFKAYASRNRDPEITASNIDFSKPLDEQIKVNKENEEENKEDAGDPNKEVMKFPTYCYACGKAGDANMCIANIPFFKEIIIMAFSCEFCGYRNTDVK
jgi:hypothetical protein